MIKTTITISRQMGAGGSYIAMLRTLDEEAWARTGTANNNQITVRALAFIIAGHVRHHMNVLRERYLTNAISQQANA